MTRDALIAQIPMVRVHKTYTVVEPPSKEVLDILVQNGFEFEVVAPRKLRASANGSATKVRRLRRRGKRRAKLTAERVREFRKARADGKSYRRIGAIFGVSDARAWQIVNKGV